KVADVAVIGVPDAVSGERVCACVVLRPGAMSLTLAEVRAFMEARGAMRQKIPEQLEVVAELPRNATGKVRKDVLRARFRASLAAARTPRAGCRTAGPRSRRPASATPP